MVAKMKKSFSFSDDGYNFLHNARKLASNKSGFDGLGYFLDVTLYISADGFANNGKITHRQYSLGTWHKWDWGQYATLDYGKQEFLGADSPSKIQSKLTSRGIMDVKIADIEKGIIDWCMQTFNNGVRWEKSHQCDLDFEKRKVEFLAELDKLKKRFEVSFQLETDWVGENEVDAYINIVDKHYTDHERIDNVTEMIIM